MANSRKFCALFLESSRSSLKTCQPSHYHLATGLEATGGPLGPAQPLKASKLADKLHQKSIYTQCRWLTMLGPASKHVSHATITCQLVQRPLEVPWDPHNHSKASKLADKLHQKSIYTQSRRLTMLGPASKRVSHATITC